MQEINKLNRIDIYSITLPKKEYHLLALCRIQRIAVTFFPTIPRENESTNIHDV